MTNSLIDPKDYLRYEIVAGASQDAPVYESHKRGKNWMAVIRLDPTAPNGLGRVFVPKAKGDDNYYIVEGAVQAGDAIEFGADYYTGGGSKHATRWYGVVVSMTGKKIVLAETATAKKAIKLANQMKEQEQAIPLVEELRRQLADLEAEADKIKARIEELTAEVEGDSNEGDSNEGDSNSDD
jgi:hypothetical protein